MSLTEFFEACVPLLNAGWKPEEIERLYRFRESFVQTRLDRGDLDIRHLEFMRWLVLSGRLAR